MDNNTANKHTIDFDIQGIVGLRLVNPSEYDVKYISRLLSQFKSDLNREPDITKSYKEDWNFYFLCSLVISLKILFRSN